MGCGRIAPTCCGIGNHQSHLHDILCSARYREIRRGVPATHPDEDILENVRAVLVHIVFAAAGLNLLFRRIPLRRDALHSDAPPH